jgi:hypothetical protein
LISSGLDFIDLGGWIGLDFVDLGVQQLEESKGICLN